MKIEGYFDNLKNANEAVNLLKESGLNNASLDLNDNFPDRNVERNIAGTETAPNLSNLVLGSGNLGFTDSTKAPLLAASPMVSGMAGFEEIAGYNYKVVAEISDEEVEQAKKIFHQFGGSITGINN
ncbi:hypothetical protein [Alkaliphilus sp. B6464]|uniref:hypothetical protein n=1 Tax=Alkaliphilus sp. B6464 TaxID=2731219 RepID=UPI001BAA81E6|nr:hypothetical protein [Alkaliphilus sp. B6464]QUH20430.1 hypothetical protein HYG84_11335 [Alkaliphilus sp. B6464]